MATGSSVFFLFSTLLVGVAVAAGFDNRHLAVVQRIPRVPLGMVNKLVHERRLPEIDMGLWGGDGMDMDCDFDESGAVMDCKMKNGEDEYELHEDCSFEDDEFKMSCKVCTDTADPVADEFEFCYEVSCDFGSLLTSSVDSIDEEFTLADLEGTACKCVYARINGENCDYCGICELDEEQKESDEETLLFSNLALECPHMDLVTSSCDVPESESSQTLESQARSSAASTQEDGMSSWAKSVTVLLVIGCVASIAMYAVLFLRNKKPSEATPTFSGRAQDDDAEML